MVNIGTVRIGPVGGTSSLGIGMPLSGGLRTNIASSTVAGQQPSSLMNINFPAQNQSGLTGAAPSPQFQIRPNPTGTSVPNLPSSLITQHQRPSVNLSGPPPSTNVPPPTVNVMNRPPPNFSQQSSIPGVVLNTSAPPPQQNPGLMSNHMANVGLRTSVPPPGIPVSSHPGLPPGAHINPQVYPSFGSFFFLIFV